MIYINYQSQVELLSQLKKRAKIGFATVFGTTRCGD